MDIDTKVLQQMGGEYILAALPINNYRDIGLSFERSFVTKAGYWKVYLYKVR
ncbi:DUF6044 family protein [Tigheibacillus jepli]|uniref:DUF6044 family protein n=1 Tax=Tigheibacillus jepli TaxID=3035914 RepID=UPI00387E0CB6